MISDVFKCAVALLFAKALLLGDEIQVTNLLDSGAGSFREALIQADEDRILFDESLSGQITLLSPLPLIDKEVVVEGPKSGAVTISGNDLFPIFQVEADQVFTVNHLQITSAASTGSGAAFSLGFEASVTVSNSLISDCVADGVEGGAVHIGADASFHVNEVTFSNNTSGGFGDDFFLEEGSLLDYTCSSLASPINVFGSGQVRKRGEGTMVMTVSSQTSLSLFVEEGEAIATGVRTEPTVVLGKLTGSQTTRYVANQGIVKPSETIGMLIAMDNYQQTEGATLEIAISPEASDCVQAGGTAHLRGNLSILPEPGIYAVGTTYTILTAEKGVDAIFSSVTSSSMSFDVHCLSNRIDIEMTSL